MTDPRYQIDIPEKPRNVQLHLAWLPEPLDLETRYAGVDPEDGTDIWLAVVPLAVTGSEVFDAETGEARFQITADWLPECTLSIAFEGRRTDG